MTFLEPRGIPGLVSKLRGFRRPHAVTASLAAARRAPVAAARVAAVYVDDPSAVADSLDLRPAEAGANVRENVRPRASDAGEEPHVLAAIGVDRGEPVLVGNCIEARVAKDLPPLVTIGEAHYAPSGEAVKRNLAVKATERWASATRTSSSSPRRGRRT